MALAFRGKATSIPSTVPIDPVEGPNQVLKGRVVTMDDDFAVLEKGAVYLAGGLIADVRPAGDLPPAGFEDAVVLNTRGTIYPGLINLHDHMSYDALTLWQVPRLFTNRSQWGSGGVEDYRRLVSGPMKVIGPSPELMPAIVRYVECKALVAGTTTSQGIQLFSNAGARRYYRGNIRNVEKTDDKDLPGADTKISDVDAKSAAAFLKAIQKKKCYLLHLSEGVDESAREHFLALKLPSDKWAIADSLAGIHCAALKRQDFAVLAQHGASMVWSPLSNLLLYGRTADIRAAKDEGVKVGLGSDWSPTGSKNLLGELKTAQLASAAEGGVFEEREIVAMATRTASAILKWDAALGTVERGKRSDLLVIRGAQGDPYTQLLRCTEADVALVLIGGKARYGLPSFLKRLGASGVEKITVGGNDRLLNLRQLTADPVVGEISFAQARERLKHALRNLKELAKEAEHAPPIHAAAIAAREERWGLALDELEPTGLELRPRVPLHGRAVPTGPTLVTAALPKPLSDLLGPLKLDPLTVVDDGRWLDTIDDEANLPDWVAPGLRELYGE
jgi:5-methylthioadenosine/S-adenosylhomocysteine deaminase